MIGLQGIPEQKVSLARARYQIYQSSAHTMTSLEYSTQATLLRDLGVDLGVDLGMDLGVDLGVDL